MNDVVMFHRKKKSASRMAKATVDLPDDSAMAQLSIDTVKVEKLVKEFLTAQSLSILPQNSFGDAVAQFVDKDDKHAMETFVKDSLKSQQMHLLNTHGVDVDELVQEMEQYKSQMEGSFAAGHATRKVSTLPAPKSIEVSTNPHVAQKQA